MSYRFLSQSSDVDDSQGSFKEDEHERIDLQYPKARFWYSTKKYLVASLILNLVLTPLLFSKTLSNFAYSKTGGTSTVAQQFHRDYNYTSLDHRYDLIWEEQAPDIIGFYTNTGVPNGAKELGLFSMHHQLHCIGSMRKALQKAYEGEQIAKDQHENSHWPHCLDYLRQTILCHADDIIERQNVRSDGSISRVISGYQEFRQCGNSELLWDIMNTSERWVPPA